MECRVHQHPDLVWLESVSADELMERLPVIPYGLQVAVHLPMLACVAFDLLAD